MESETQVEMTRVSNHCSDSESTCLSNNCTDSEIARLITALYNVRQLQKPGGAAVGTTWNNGQS